MMELREAIAEADDSKELNQIQSQVPFEHPDSSAFLQTLLVTFLKLKFQTVFSFGHWLNQCGFVVIFKVQENLKQWSDSFADNFESQRFDEAVNCIRRMTYYEKACEEIVKKLWGKQSSLEPFFLFVFLKASVTFDGKHIMITKVPLLHDLIYL